MLIIRKIVTLLVSVLLLFSLKIHSNGDYTQDVSARCCIVMHSDGQVLYEKNGDKRALIASTTKLMTALIVLENSELSQPVEIKSEHCGIEGSSMYLKPGQRYTVEELLLGLLLASGNDAAVALAEHVAGSEKAFVSMMNRKAAELAMDGTSFANPHGLDDSGHYSTARDMARLMLACMAEPDFSRICGTRESTISGESFQNHNRLLWLCPGCVTGKTGYTMAAGRCLVSCCKRNDTQLVCVTLSAPDDWNDHMRLYDWAYSRFGNRNITAGLEFAVPVVSGDKEYATVLPAEELNLFLPKTEELTLKADLPQFVFAPVKSGETAGTLWVIMDGEPLKECPMVYGEDIELAQPCSELISNMEGMI